MCSFSTARHAGPEQPGLAEVVVEGGRVRPHLRCLGHLDRDVDEGASVVAGEEGAAAVERVRPVRRDARVHGVLVEAVAEHVVDRRVRSVDRDLGEVRPAQPGQLRVDVGEQPALQQRVVRHVDARAAGGRGGRRPARSRRRSWSGCRSRIEPPDRLHRRQLLGHDLRRVEQVDALEGLAPGCPGRPACRAPTPGRRRPRSRRRGRGGGSPGRRRRSAAPPPRSASARPAWASSGT